MCRIFREVNLSITIEVNHNVGFDLNTGIYRPYIKPNDKPLYINVNSNHPPSIIK